MILLLEDEFIVMKLLRHMLKQYGLVEATSAERALRLFSVLGRQIDLLVADLTLPISSGIQVALAFRSEVPNLPIILTSGYPASGWSDRDTANLKGLGANAIMTIQKPFQAKVRLDAVCNLLGKSHVEIARTA